MLPIYEYNGTLAGNLLEDTDVVNALTSNETAKPLSAAQGKALNSKINEKPKVLWEGSFSSYEQTITLNENIFNFKQIYLISTNGIGTEKSSSFQLPFVIESGKTIIHSSIGFFPGQIRVIEIYLDQLTTTSNSVHVRGWDWLNNSSNNSLKFNRVVGIR